VVSNIRFSVNKQLLELSVCTNKSKFVNWVGEVVNNEYKVERQPLIRIGENSYNNLISNITINAYGGGGDSLSVLAIDDGWNNTVELLDVIADSLTNGVEIRTGHDSARVYRNVVQNSRFYLGNNIAKFFIDMNKENFALSSVILKDNIFRGLQFFGTPKNAAVRFDGDNNLVIGSWFENGAIAIPSTVFTQGSFINNYVLEPGQSIKKLKTLGNYNNTLIYPILTQNATNNGVGTGTLGSLTGGTNNTAIGENALNTITSSNNNTAVGFEALKVATSGPNTAIGSQALAATTTGGFNTAVGFQSLFSNVTGQKNIGLGRNTLRLATGNGNIAIGNTAGDDITTGEDNIIIATDGISLTPTTSNYMNIGKIIYGTGVNTPGNTPSGGSIGINQKNPAYTLDVTGTGRFTGALRTGAVTYPTVDGTNGQVLSTNGSGTVSFTTISVPTPVFAQVSGSNFTTTNTTATTITGLTRS